MSLLISDTPGAGSGSASSPSPRAHINPGLVPPGGWSSYVELDGTGLVAYSLDGLLRAIVDHRVASGVPAGDPAADVADYFCSRYPQSCFGSTGGSASSPSPSPTDGSASGSGELADPLPSSAPRPLTLLERVTVWTQVLTGGSLPELLDPAAAEDRAGRCLRCPNNVPYQGCCGLAAQSQTVADALAAVRQGRDVAYGRELHGCKVLGIDVRTAAWLPLSLVPAAGDESRLPEFCWNRGRRQP